MMHKFLLILLFSSLMFAYSEDSSVNQLSEIQQEEEEEEEERMASELNYISEKSKTIKTNIPEGLSQYEFKLTKTQFKKMDKSEDSDEDEDSVSLTQSGLKKDDSAHSLLNDIESMDANHELEFKSPPDNQFKQTRRRSR